MRPVTVVTTLDEVSRKAVAGLLKTRSMPRSLLPRWIQPSRPESRNAAAVYNPAHNTHLSMWLKEGAFADRDEIPWGILDSGSRALRLLVRLVSSRRAIPMSKI